jgi:hypothetical protein
LPSAPSRYSDTTRADPFELNRSRPAGLGLSFRDRFTRWISPSRFRLSWDSSDDRPSSVYLPVSPLPQTRRPASATRQPDASSRSALVVSHHLDGLLLTELAGLLHPASGHGVHCVSRLSPPRRAEARAWWRVAVPTVPGPFEVSPRRQPYRVTAAVALLLLLRCESTNRVTLESRVAPQPGTPPGGGSPDYAQPR